MFLALAQHLLRLLAVTDVLFDGNVTGDHPVAVPQWGDRHLLGIEAAVLAAVGHLPAPNLTGGNRLPEVSIGRLILLAAFKYARGFSDGFLCRVAGECCESGVNRLNRAVVVGNHDGIGCRIECCGLHAKLLLALAQRFFRALVLGHFRLEGAVALLQLAGALGNPGLQPFHSSLDLLVQPPFLRQRLRQLQRFHGIKRLFEDEQPVAPAEFFKHLTP